MNVWIAVESGSPAHYVLELSTPPVSLTAIFIFGSGATSGNGSGISKSGLAENVGEEVGIASLSVTVQQLFALPVLVTTF